MRVNTERTLTQSGTMQSKSVKMTFDENSIQHLMSVLTDLYSDPALAVIREYSTNALDSHIAAGNSDPIKVYLPNSMNPTFRVVDNGTGLSVEDLTNIYSKYGYSTKRDNDNESGMLGLGCKAGLTYTDQFTLTAVKNGVKTLATVSRAEDGTGSINIIDTRQTDEPNGVTISVGVRNTHDFNQRAHRFFQFWESGTVLVDDQEPTAPKGLEVGDDIIVSQSLDSDYVVMGNIGYDVGSRLSGGLPYGWHVAGRVSMGDVNFTPNREALHYTSLTERAIKNIIQKRDSGLQAAAQNAIDAASSKLEALSTYREWESLASKGFTYKGQEVPTSFSLDGIEGFVYDKNAYRYATSGLDRRLYVGHALKSMVVTGFELDSVSYAHRAKVKQYIDENGLSVRYIYFVNKMFGDGWLDGLPTVDYSVIKAVKLPRNTSGGSKKRPKQKFIVWRNGVYDEVDKVVGNDIIIFSSARRSGGRDPLDGAIISGHFPNATVVDLAKNRWDKFRRENSNVRTYADAIKDDFDIMKATLSTSMKLALGPASRRLDYLSQLNEDNILDPELKTLVKSLRNPPSDDKRNKVKRTIARYRDVFGWYAAEIDYSVNETEVLDKYPLLSYSSSVSPEHTTEYVNHFYAARAAEKDN